MKYHSLVTAINIFFNDDNPLFGDSVTEVNLLDEAGGPFIELSQSNEFVSGGKIRINDMDEMDAIYAAVTSLLMGVAKYSETNGAKMTQYLTNKIRTPDGHILQSFSRHDYKTYTDKISGEEYMVDGGLDYLRRNVTKIPAEELSLVLPQPHSVIREELTWGTYGKKGDQPLKFLKICDMESDHIVAVLETQHLGDLRKLALQNELKFRGDV